MNRLISFFASLRLTVVLLLLSMVLVFAGTLAQVDQGIWSVMEQYFRCFMARIDLHVFFPRSLTLPRIWIPFPGGFLLGGLLVINLLAAHWNRFRVQAVGTRRAAGIIVLLAGVLVTAGVMFGWGTAPVAATEGDAFWRVFLRLGRGTAAAAVLYAACVLLYRRQAGMVLLHGGILFLLIGEFATALHAVESSMTIKEGETVNFVDRSQQYELAFIDGSDPAYDQVTVIPDRLLKDGALIHAEALPFDIRVNRFMANTNPPQPLENVSEPLRRAYPIYQSHGALLYVAEQPEAGGAAGTRNAPAVDLSIIDRDTGKDRGRYILPIWFYPNFVNRTWDLPVMVTAAGREYPAYFRFRREYLTSPSGSPFAIRLIDFVHEKYEGTQMPKDFSSRIRLVNEGDGVDRELRIWMNNPLRYARRTFYQSGYLPDESGTVLQVVRNDTWMIPYLSCMIVFVGMTDRFVRSFGRHARRGVK